MVESINTVARIETETLDHYTEETTVIVNTEVFPCSAKADAGMAARLGNSTYLGAHS